MAETPTTDTAANGGGGDKTYTHEEFEREMGRRLKRQRDQFPSSEELEELREAKKQLDAIEETSKDDLERASGRIKQLETDLAERDSAIESLKSTTRDLTVKQTVIAEAAKAQFGEEKKATFVNPEDAFRFLEADKIEYDDDGNATNIAALVEGIAGSNQHLLGARRAAGPDMDLGPRETSTDRPDMSAEQEHAQWLAERI